MQNSFAGPLDPGATIELFAPNGRSRGTFDAVTDLSFASWRYEGKRVARAVISWNPTVSRFAIHNLTYHFRG